jgi:hypothetical protein
VIPAAQFPPPSLRFFWRRLQFVTVTTIRFEVLRDDKWPHLHRMIHGNQQAERPVLAGTGGVTGRRGSQRRNELLQMPPRKLDRDVRSGASTCVWRRADGRRCPTIPTESGTQRNPISDTTSLKDTGIPQFFILRDFALPATLS